MITASHRSQTGEAILLMVCSMAFFSAMNIGIRMLSETMAPTQMVFLRNVFSLLLIVLWQAALRRDVPRFPTQRIKGHFWRASIGFIAMELWFYAITLMPLTLATALSFTTPIFSTAIAIAFLGEKAGIRRWSAIGIGFVGMLVILRPDTGQMDASAFIVLGSSAVMAVAGVLVKTLTRTEPPETIVFYMALFMTLWSFPLALPVWGNVVPDQLWLVLWIALFSTGAHLMMARAFRRADLVTLMPFDFTRLVFTAALAWLFFGETVDASTVAGSLLIVASTVYIAHREARKRIQAAGTADVSP